MTNIMNWLILLTDKLGTCFRNTFKTTKDLYIDTLKDTCNRYLEKMDNDKEYIYKLHEIIADLQTKNNVLKMEITILKEQSDDLMKLIGNDDDDDIDEKVK